MRREYLHGKSPEYLCKNCRLYSLPTNFQGFTVLLLQVNMEGRLLQPAVCCADFVQLSDIRWKIRPIQQDSHST